MITYEDIQFVEVGERTVAALRHFKADAGDVHHGGKHVHLGHQTVKYAGAFDVEINGGERKPAGLFTEIDPDSEHTFYITQDGTEWGCWFHLTDDQQLLPPGSIRALTLEK